MYTTQTICRLNARDLDNQFLEALKILFADKEIEIIVTELDETAYLLGTPANRQRLLQALEAAKQAHNLIEASFEEHSETGETINLLSPDEYNAWQETLYLLSTAANAEQLMRSIAEDRAGQRIQPDGFDTL